MCVVGFATRRSRAGVKWVGRCLVDLFFRELVPVSLNDDTAIKRDQEEEGEANDESNTAAFEQVFTGLFDFVGGWLIDVVSDGCGLIDRGLEFGCTVDTFRDDSVPEVFVKGGYGEEDGLGEGKDKLDPEEDGECSNESS